ncbi:Hypothetical predicted protein [Octopus vulgaris]|uniref:Uncharacterized protein n=1 Tax=Octopus vulgaris TaxID=6645 RepID=A0AA36F9G8_OCTVU|nr:Hypothetical predicted protein [Octopus vulgaris]
MVFYSFAYYSKKDGFCTGKQLTLLPQKIYSICGTYVSKKDAMKPPTVKVERVPKHEEKKYILIMISPDRIPDSKWVWLHWMKTGISSKKFQGITTEKSDDVGYKVPKQTSGVYRIQFLLGEYVMSRAYLNGSDNLGRAITNETNKYTAKSFDRRQH